MGRRGPRQACARCGFIRERKTALCRDCRYVLSPAEVALWLDAELVVESYHEKEVA